MLFFSGMTLSIMTGQRFLPPLHAVFCDSMQGLSRASSGFFTGIPPDHLVKLPYDGHDQPKMIETDNKYTWYGPDCWQRVWKEGDMYQDVLEQGKVYFNEVFESSY